MPVYGRRDWRDVVSSGRHMEILAGLDISGTADDSDDGGVYLLRWARSTVSRTQVAEQRKSRRAETDYETREADFHCRFPGSGI